MLHGLKLWTIFYDDIIVYPWNFVQIWLIGFKWKLQNFSILHYQLSYGKKKTNQWRIYLHTPSPPLSCTIRLKSSIFRTKTLKIYPNMNVLTISWKVHLEKHNVQKQLTEHHKRQKQATLLTGWCVPQVFQQLVQYLI